MQYKQYQCVIVNLDPTVGSEIQKTRPCVILSPDEMNRYIQTVVIAPITSQSKPYPTRIEITINGKPNWVVLDQIRTIDKSRILKFLHLLDDSEIAFIKRAIQATFVN